MQLFDFRSTLRPFRHRAFLIYNIGNALSLMGTWMHRVGAGWLTWQLTESGTWLGAIAAAEFMPALVVMPLAGAAADRLDRLTVMRITQLISMAITLIVFVATATGFMTIWLLFVLTGLLGIVTAFSQPMRMAFVPSLVPREELGPALAVNSLILNLSRFTGPMVAGVLIVVFGMASVFLGNAISFLVFFLALSNLRLPPPSEPSKPHGSFVVDLRDGVRYTVGHTGIASLLLLLIAMAIGGRSLHELLPGFAGGVFDTGPAGLSILTSAIGGGAIVGAFWLSGQPVGRGYFQYTLVSLSILAVAVMAFSVMPGFWLAVVMIAIFGAVSSIGGICAQTSVQLAVDRAMAGRVLGLYGFIFRGAPPLGAMIIGIASDQIGLRIPTFLGGLVLAASCVLAFLNRGKITASLETSSPPV